MLKKIFLVSVIAASTFGCTDPAKIKVSNLNFKELAIVNGLCNKKVVINNLHQVVNNRTAVSQEGVFCEALDLIPYLDNSLKKCNKSHPNITEASLAYYGKTPAELCGSKKVGHTTDNFLQPEMYDKLIEVSLTCDRSKQELITATHNKGNLTLEDYDNVMSAVLSCKRFELEQRLQGH